MQRKPGFPMANCNIKMPDSVPVSVDTTVYEEESERRRLQLINFGHSQWGFNNWSWSVTKQDLDFVDFAGGRYAAGVVAFVSITVKSLDIHRENIGYATATAPMKGSAIYQARKGAVTNALRETILGFGGSVTTDLQDLLEANKPELAKNTPHLPEPAIEPENNQNVANKILTEPKNIRNELNPVVNTVNNVRPHAVNPVIKNPPIVPVAPPVAKTHPMPNSLPPPANRQHVPAPPRPAPPPAPPAECSAPLEGMSEEEARAERRRRQRLKQEEFRQRQQQMRGPADGATVDKRDLQKCTFDTLLMALPSQDIVIEETGASASHDGKRKSPEPGPAAKRRGSVVSKLDIVTD